MANDTKKFTASGQSATAPSADEISAHGDVKVRLEIIRVVGAVIIILAIGGVAVWIWQPDRAKDMWVYIAPTLSAAVTGAFGFLAGERSGRQRAKR
jgi:hypothetical protein